ncbi:MAG: helix-turn-helix domain-containing protein [bacterium]|nr:helix-turn-helix domain-containing protein [bacterium]
MNLEVANRLQQLRKAKGLSQEELANILGLSRQAISKWERAETSPDTDNLICLARLYNISIDKLLDTSESTEEIKERIAQERIDEISNKSEDEKTEEEIFEEETMEEVETEVVEEKVELAPKEVELKKKRDELAGNLWFSFFALGVAVYIISGLITKDWGWGWQFIFVGLFAGNFLTQLFVNRTYAGVSLMISMAFAFWVLFDPTEKELTDKLIISLSFLGGLFILSLIPIILFVKFNMKNRKEIVVLNEKDELIRLQDKCKRIIEANEKYKQELKDINK